MNNKIWLYLWMIGTGAIILFMVTSLYLSEPERRDRNYELDVFCREKGFDEYDRRGMAYNTKEFKGKSYLSCHREIMNDQGEIIHEDRWIEWNEYLVFTEASDKQ